MGIPIALLQRAVAAENLIQLDGDARASDCVIIRERAGTARTAGSLAVVAGEVAPPARS
jgi:hypothetical protein